MQEKQHFWERGKTYTLLVLTVFIPIILAIIGILLPIALEQGKHLSLEVIENKALISVDQKIREEINISYNDKVVERLFLITVKFVNDGDLGINGKTDIVESIEISLREDNCKIIGEPEILENPSDIKLAFYPAMNQKTVKFDFDLMNSNDYFIMDILYTANDLVSPNLHAKIVDIKDIEIRSWKGSHHRIPFHFKYGWFTPSYTTNAIERFTPSYTLNDTKLWKTSQR